jgi:hypothetical protein
MASDLYDHLAELKDKVNAHVRAVTIGLLAFAAGIIGAVFGFGSSATHPTLPHSTAMALILVMLALFLVLVIDLGQTILSILTTEHIIDAAEVLVVEEESVQSKDDMQYDYEHWAYVGAGLCFWSKLALLGVTTIAFAVVTAKYCIENLRHLPTVK